MRRSDILEKLKATGIRMEEERVVPINGSPVPLPYMVARDDETEQGDDLGRVRISLLSWTVALFTKNKDFALECKIRDALRGCGTVEVTHYPDGTPYQTSFNFASHERR